MHMTGKPLIDRRWIPHVRIYLIQQQVSMRNRVYIEDVLWGKRPLESLSSLIGNAIVGKTSGPGAKMGHWVADWGRDSAFNKFMQRYPDTNPYNPDKDAYQYLVFLLYAYHNGKMSYKYRFGNGALDDGDRLYQKVESEGLR